MFVIAVKIVVLTSDCTMSSRAAAELAVYCLIFESVSPTRSLATALCSFALSQSHTVPHQLTLRIHLSQPVSEPHRHPNGLSFIPPKRRGGRLFYDKPFSRASDSLASHIPL